MTDTTRFDRRTLLKGTAAGTAALALPGAGTALASSPRGTTTVEFGPGATQSDVLAAAAGALDEEHAA